MATFDELLAGLGVIGPDADHLHRLVADWQLLADLSFADLLLVVPAAGGDAYVVVAQMRPTTGPTAHQDDLVGRRLSSIERPQLGSAFEDRRIVREGDPVWAGGMPVREEALPVTRGGRVIAAIVRDTNLAAARTPSRLEIAYLNSADDLVRMLAEGSWPDPADTTTLEAAGPRVGDGLIRLDEAGLVTFVSPNALSAYRRLGHPGDLVGLRLSEVTAALSRDSTQPVDQPAITTGRVAGSVDVEAVGGTGPPPAAGPPGALAVVQLRSIPLRVAGRHGGALLLVRDVTELRRRERLLLSKDATIREIHHRVKNNLQTVAALLRLQARRLNAPEARDALAESVRRVSSIAVVHETLSGSLDETVSFDDIADRILAMVTEVAGDGRVELQRTGRFGILPAEVATPLALVLTELLHNACEHGYPEPATGRVEVQARWLTGTDRPSASLEVTICDAGRGLPPDFDPASSDRLGLQIVRTLAETELGGRLTLQNRPGGGTTAQLLLPSAGG